jgi:ankyrin repeat protein
MKNLQQLCDTLQIPIKQGTADQLVQLKIWCTQNISQDRIYPGTEGSPKEYEYYINLVKHYLKLQTAHSPIQYAVQHGFNRFIEGTEAEPQTFNQETSHGPSPLYIAAQMGHYHTVLALLAKGANPHQLNKQMQLPLGAALMLPIIANPRLKANKIKIAERLLEETSNDELKHRDISGNTICHLMAVYGFSQLLEKLLQSHSKLALIHNNNASTPLHAAILNQQSQCVRVLLQVEGASTGLDAKKRMAIHYAALYGNEQIIELCCAQCPDLNALDTDGKTPLILAIEAKNTTAVKLLLLHGADKSHLDTQGMSPLELAQEGGDSTILALLADHRHTQTI